MSYSYKKDREQTIARLSKMGFDYAQIMSLLRCATTIERTGALLSSVDMGARETARQEKREESAEHRAQEIIEGVGFKFSPRRDVRAYPFHVILPATGTEYGIPGRGFPESFWNRH